MQYESEKSGFVSGFAAGKDILLRKPVADRVEIALADSAVETVVPAVVGEFNQSADIDIVSIVAMPLFPCQ